MKRAYLRPPLRDAQRETPQWCCRACGQEQYQTDPGVLRRGRLLCLRCARAESGEEGYGDAV